MLVLKRRSMSSMDLSKISNSIRCRFVSGDCELRAVDIAADIIVL